MLTFIPPQAIHGDSLVEQIESAGYTSVEVAISGDSLLVSAQTSSGADVDERSRSSIQSVIDAHTGAVPEDELRPSQVRAKIELRIAQAEQAYTDWPTLTTNQKLTVLRETVLAVAKLGRLTLSKYDTPE